MTVYQVSVGINDYPGTGADLYGCVNDANDWAGRGVARGHDVTTLHNADATRANIVDALRTALHTARGTDQVVFTYSGHGGWVPALGDTDEDDGRHECLVCYDYDAPGQAGLLLDDDLGAIFDERGSRGRSVAVIDACHSGTVTRFADLLATTKPGVQQVRFLAPEHYTGVTREAAISWEASVDPAPTPRAAPILFAGAADHEYAYDARIDGRARGAFTAAALAAADAGRARSWQQWLREVRKALPSEQYPQTPQLGASVWQRYTRPVLA